MSSATTTKFSGPTAMNHAFFWRRKAPKLLFEFILLVLTLVYLYPFYAVIVLAIKTPQQMLMAPMALPKTLEIANFTTAWQLTNFPRAFFNTLFITVVSVVLIIAVTGMGTFTLVKVRNKLSTFMYYFLICGLMIPFYLSLSPSVKLMSDFHLMNNIVGLSISYVGRNVAFAVFLFMGFMRTIPDEISESATMDGCRPFKLYWLIYFPMLKSVVNTLAILDALAIWNDFLFPLLILQSKKYQTLTLVQYIFRSEENTQWNLIFASYILSMVPLLIFYFALQKNIVEGITAGAVKG